MLDSLEIEVLVPWSRRGRCEAVLLQRSPAVSAEGLAKPARPCHHRVLRFFHGGQIAKSSESGRLTVRIEGATIEPGKVAVRDLTKLGELIQAGLERVARVLSGEPGGIPGPLPGPIRNATELLLAGIERGSATLLLELPPPQEEEATEEKLFEPPAGDLGLQALDRLVEGMHSLEAGTEQVPDGWDNSVMEIAERLAETVAARNFQIDLDAQTPRGQRRHARIAPNIADRFSIRHARVRRPRTARGELIAVDLRKGRIDVEDNAGRRVQCEFDPEAEELMSRVRQLIGERVTVSGEEEFDVALNKAGRLEVHSLERATEEVPLHDMFWRNLSGAEQAVEQGVGPVRSVTELAASEELTEEDLASFAELLREARREE
jgi:hypothetical protein